MTSEIFSQTYVAITQGFIIGFFYAASIGPVNFLAIRRGIVGGFQQTFMVGAGAALVDACCAYLIFAGLLRMGFTGVLKIILWGLCAVFLIYLAYSMLTEIKENPEMAGNVKVRKQTQFLEHSFVMGLLIVASNPFTLFYWIGMVGTLHLSGGMELTGMAATSFFSAVLVSELIWYSCLGMGVHHSRNLFNRRALKVIAWICGLSLLVYYLLYATKVVLNLLHTGGASFLTQ